MILYKYMPFRESFFDDPILRLTPPSSLNDPFDSKPTNSAIEKKSNFFIDASRYPFDDEINNSYEDDESIRKYYSEDLRNKLESFGIISLTQRNDNLLMWSHYANDHNGIVIAISCDEDTFDYHQDNFRCDITTKLPVKVEYSPDRPGFVMPDSAIYEYFENNFHLHIATSKGVEWASEEEYRYLINRFELDLAIAEVNLELNFPDNKDILITKMNDNKYKIEASSFDKKNMLIWHLASLQGCGFLKNVMYFKRINKSAIKEVYFGCRVSRDHIISSIEKVRNSNYFKKDTVFYVASENQDLYKIDFGKFT